MKRKVSIDNFTKTDNVMDGMHSIFSEVVAEKLPDYFTEEETAEMGRQHESKKRNIITGTLFVDNKKPN